MSSKKTRATPANVPRSRSCWTRRQRQQIKENCKEIRRQQEAYEALYGDDDPFFRDDDGDACQSCDGEGYICVCCDDICQGCGECIHGDGMAECDDCEGYGYYRDKTEVDQ